MSESNTCAIAGPCIHPLHRPLCQDRKGLPTMNTTTDAPAKPQLVPFDEAIPSPLKVNGTSKRRKTKIVTGDARSMPLDDDVADLIVTSPPYWRKRDYGVADQIGQESTPQGYVDAMMDCLTEWARVLRPTGSVFLNVGDTFHKKSLVGIPGRLEAAAHDAGWIIRNRIIWAKTGGMPEAVKNRLAARHEYVIHLVRQDNYYYDLFGLLARVWQRNQSRGRLVVQPRALHGRASRPLPDRDRPTRHLAGLPDRGLHSVRRTTPPSCGAHL